MSADSKLYRARDGMILGVCQGLARYRSLPVTGMRAGVILLTIFTGFWPGVALYFLAGFLMEPEPLLRPENQSEQDFYTRFHGSRAVALHELGERMKHLDQRLRRMEDRVTQADFNWKERLRP